MGIDKQMNILLVEDSNITREMEKRIIKDLGFHNILEAVDGDDAIKKLQEEKGIDLIISDWNMPNKDGYELLKWVRSDEKCHGIPFIMATARGEKKHTTQIIDAGSSNFLIKPFNAQELNNVIEETFGIKKESSTEDIEQPKPPRKTASGKVRITAAHIQITDHLTLGVLKNLIASKKFSPKYFELETQCMPSWNPVQKALEKGDVDAAFILAPIAMDLFNFGVPIKLVLFAHKNGSISVRNKKGDNQKSLKEFFRDKIFYIPHILSIHHMLSYMFLSEIGLKPGVTGNDDVDVFFEVVPPIKMPEFLAKSPEVGGYTVAEPLGTKAIASGIGNLSFLSGQIWEYHPCCVVVMRDDFINAYPDAVQEFTDLLVQSGQFIDKEPDRAALIAVQFLDPEKKLGLKLPVLKNILKEPLGIKTDDLFPVIDDLDRIQRYMVEEMGVGTMIDLEKFVDTRFAKVACKDGDSSRHHSVVHDLSKVVSEIVTRQATDDESKAMLNREGKYLLFTLDNQEYGIEIIKIREIIGMMPIRAIPQTPPFVKGVVNLRGKVIPVIDLRLRFGMEEIEYSERTCIIVVGIAGQAGTVLIGIVVDAVSEVLNIKSDQIEETPTFGTKLNTDHILGMAKMEGSVKILLEIDRVLTEEDVVVIEKAA